MTYDQLPDVDRVQGVLYTPPNGPDLSQGLLRLQYTDRTGATQELLLRTPDALTLLNWLEQWSKDAQLDHLRRPPPQ